MKKGISLFIVFVLFMIIVGCNKNKVDISSGTYVMELSKEHAPLNIPSLTLKSEDKTFTFFHDLLSSYLPYGTYEISNDQLIAETYDDKYKYVFNIIDNKTLSFNKEKSSVVTTLDKKATPPVYDGAKFKRVTKK